MNPIDHYKHITQLSMGLSISDSAAERERVQQLALKQIRIAGQSQAKSQSRNRDPIVAPQYVQTASPLKKDLKASEHVQIKKAPKWKDKMGTALEDQEMGKQQQIPAITVNPPPKVSSYQFQQKKHKEALQKSKLSPMVHEEPAQYPLNIPIKDTEKVQVLRNEVDKRESRRKEYLQPSPVKLGVENLTENISPSRPKKQVDEASILTSGSRTLTLKKSIPGVDEPQSVPEHHEHRNLDVQFEDFDWGIPRTKGEQEIGLTKRLKPEASVVLTSKFGQEEETGEESGEKRKWKTRRELMKEIVNDRLETVDNFSLPRCNPNGGFESIHHFCS